ncbi:MAG: hypothetical protein L3J09_08645 [Flavobacteriaceae bacterium]|nr:hypothetical protein [Flavobacteriaceae bacterium]
MAPIKFENHIREQLQERETQPSVDAWKKLQPQLNQTPKKKSNTKWYVIAASVVGFIIIASVLFNKTSQITTSPAIVETNSSQEQIISIQTENNIPEIKEIISKQETQIVQEDNLDNVKNTNKVITVDKSKKSIKKESEIVFQSKDINKENENVNSNTNLKEVLMPSETEITSIKVSKEEDFENEKVAEIVVQVTHLQSVNNTVSAEEIEALLAKAQQEITAKKLLSNNKVDAMALLNLVEEELETSFRDKVFEKLGDSFQKVRTAVVNRDN